ncbi:MAG: hypothetical protein EBU46_07570 [Nitrosomonadaceae bacterium]|nr:hypothetical protein [Nitrosomonadaceae bacterium]
MSGRLAQFGGPDRPRAARAAASVYGDGSDSEVDSNSDSDSNSDEAPRSEIGNFGKFGKGADADRAEQARNEAAAAFRRRRGAAAAGAPCAAAGCRAAWSTALRRAVEQETRFARADEGARAVPVAFARYVSPVLDLGDYEMRRAGPWRIALPRALSPLQKQETLRTIYAAGPARAGYVAIGETLVPAALGPGSRKALSDRAGDSLLDE